MKKRYSSRWGRFKVSGVLVNKMGSEVCGGEDGAESNAFKRLTTLLSKVFIFKAEHNVTDDTIDYWGISPLFEELEEGEPVPFYELEGQTIKDENTGEDKFIVKAFRRLKDE